MNAADDDCDNDHHYIRQGGYVIPSVYLSAGLLVGLHQKLQVDLSEIFKDDPTQWSLGFGGDPDQHLNPR